MKHEATNAAPEARAAMNYPESALLTFPTLVNADDFDSDRYWSPLFEEVQHAVTYKPGYRLLLKPEDTERASRWYFQIEADRVDAITGEPGTGRGGKAYLSPHACLSELVQTAFGLFKSYEEHEAREFFRFEGRQVFGPHFDVRALWAVADITETRQEPGR